MNIGTILGILFFFLIILVAIPYILYISTKNEFGDGLYNSPNDKKNKK